MQYGTVTGRILATIADRVNDPDTNPDTVPVAGKVRFTPSVGSVISSTNNAIIMPTPIEADIDNEGYISLNGVRGVTLVATDSADLNPTGFTYTVSFSDLKFDKFNLSYAAFSMALPADTTVDLSTVTPVGSSNGALIVRGPKGDPGDPGPTGPAGGVVSVAGKTGIVDLTASDVGAVSVSTATAGQVYGKNGSGSLTGVAFSPTAIAGALLQRSSGGNATVPLTPSADTDATSKKYVAGSTAPAAGARPGNRMVWLGDSLTQWQDTATPANTATSSASHSQRVSLGNLASIMSGQRALYVNNAGIGGNTTAQMLARFDTDVTPFAPTVVHLLAGTNDIGNSVALSTSIANITALIAKIREIGAVPMLGLLPPSATAPASVTRWNIAIQRLSQALGVALVDYYADLVDPATGGYLSAYQNDGTHPNAAGFARMAQSFATTASAILPSPAVPLPLTNSQSNNLIGNGLFPGTGAPWTGSPQSLTAASAPAVGNWMTLTGNGTSGNVVYQNLTTAPVAGHRYAFLGRIQTSLTSGSTGFQVRNRITLSAGAVDMMPLNNVAVNIADGVFYTEYTCPANAVSQQVMLTVASDTTGTMKIGQIALYDLTELGIV